MAEADQAPPPARAEEIAAQVNLPLQAAAQQPAKIQPAAGAQPVASEWGTTCEIRWRGGFGLVICGREACLGGEVLI